MRFTGAFPVALATSVLLAAGCGNRNTIRPVVMGSGEYEKTILIDPLKAQFTIRSPNKQFRDDGLWKGNLMLHTDTLETEFAPSQLSVTGSPLEGLLAEATDRSGNTCLVVYGLSQGSPLLDEARRAMLRATAVLKLGMREGLEQYFRQQGVTLQFRTMSDRDLAKLVEAFALHRLGCPPERVTDLETRQMVELLSNQGLGRDPAGAMPDRMRTPW